MEASRISVVTGTRPEIIKGAPIIAAFQHETGSPCDIYLTGQHKREQMIEAAAQLELAAVAGIPTTSSHWRDDLETTLDNMSRDASLLVLVIGDTDSALLTARYFSNKENVRTAHVEAGLRLTNVSEPEESNRREISSLVDFHLAPFPEQATRLLSEGIPQDSITITGDFSDLSLSYRIADLGWLRGASASLTHSYWIATVHRHSNLLRLASVGEYLLALSNMLNIELVLCRRDDSRLFHFYQNLARHSRIRLLPALPPRQFLALLAGAQGVITDSAGVQQEALMGKLPVIVLRDEVELYRSHELLYYAGDLSLEGSIGFASLHSGRSWQYQSKSIGTRVGLTIKRLQDMME